MKFNIQCETGTAKRVTLATVEGNDDATLLAKAREMSNESYHGAISIDRAEGYLAIVFHADGDYPEQALHVAPAKAGYAASTYFIGSPG